MASNRSNGLLWSLIGPAIWMALLLSVLSGRSDGAIWVEEVRPTPEAVATLEMSESTDAPESIGSPRSPEERSTLHAWAGCLEPFYPFPSEDGA